MCRETNMSKVSPRVLAARRNGRLGGLATANKSTPEFLEQRASKAGSVNSERYGTQFYSHIARQPRKKSHSRKQIITNIVQSIAPDVTQAGNISALELMQSATKAI